MSKPGVDKTPSKYQFAQQVDSTCFLMPFINLKLIREQQNEDGTLRFLDREWHTKEEWFLKTFPALRDWHLAMQKLTFPKPREAKDFARLQESMLKNGLTKDQIPSLTYQDGESYLPKRGFERVLAQLLTPYMGNVQKKWGILTKKVPVYYDNGKFTCYDESKKEFIELKATKRAHEDLNCFTVRELGIPPHLREYYQLNDNDYLISQGGGFGHERIYQTSYIDRNSILLNDQNRGYFYEASLYGLMLFGMGLDSQNNEIIEGHSLFTAYQNFKQVMSQSENNPWNSPLFKKENLLEYHIAQILKSDLELKEKIKANLNEYTSWPYYQQLSNVAGGDDTKKNLPGEDQMIAYCVSQYLKLLWAASLSPEKFLVATGLRGSLGEIDKVALDTLIKDIVHKSKHFLPIWKKLRTKLQDIVGENAFLVSFDGHGSIKSFNEKVCSAQAQYGLANKKLFQKLGYTEIDSFFQEGRQPFYQQTPDEADKMEQAARKIQSAWRKHKAGERTKPLIHSPAPVSGGLNTVYSALRTQVFNQEKQTYVNLIEPELIQNYLDYVRRLVELHRGVYLHIKEHPEYSDVQIDGLKAKEKEAFIHLEQGIEISSEDFLDAIERLNKQLISIEKQDFSKEQIDLLNDLVANFLEKDLSKQENTDIKDKIKHAFHDNPQALKKFQNVIKLLERYARYDIVSMFFNTAVNMSLEKIKNDHTHSRPRAK